MYIRVIVTPNSKKEKVIQLTKDSFEISVKEKAQQNQANGRVCEILSECFKVPLSAVRIINGHRTPKKIISIK